MEIPCYLVIARLFFLSDVFMHLFKKVVNIVILYITFISLLTFGIDFVGSVIKITFSCSSNILPAGGATHTLPR